MRKTHEDDSARDGAVSWGKAASRVASNVSADIVPPHTQIHQIDKARHQIDPPLPQLSPSVPLSSYPCTWFHVTCNNDNSVVRVDLGNAGISGALLPDLGELDNLRYLELYSNSLNGSIPATLGNLTNLISLDLWDNLLTGPIPSTLGSIGTLRYLRLYQNNLTGSIPPSFGTLTSLVELKLHQNSLSGSIPASLGNVETLQFLKLNENMLTGTVPLEVLSLVIVGNLTKLNIARNNLDGTVRSSGLRGYAEDCMMA